MVPKGGGGFPSVRRSDHPPIRRHARPLVHLGFLMKERIESYQLGKNGGGTYGCYHQRAASQNKKDDITCFTSQIVEELTKESLNGSISLKGNGDDKLPPMKEGESERKKKREKEREREIKREREREKEKERE